MGEFNAAAVVGAEMERVTPIVNALYDIDDTFYSMVDKESNVERISTRDMRIPMKLRPGGFFGHYDPNGGSLGLGGGPTFDKAVINTVHLRYACQWTKKTEWSTDDPKKAVVNAFKELMADAMPEFRRHSDSLCMQAGTGVLGTISAVTTAAGVDTVTLGTDGFGARLLRYGLKVNVYDSTLATNRTPAVEPEITFYDSPNKQIKLTPATTSIQAGDLIVVSGLSGANPVSLYGVPYHNSNASTGTWLGYDRALTPEIRANRVNASGDLALPFARLAVNKVGDRVGNLRKRKFRAFMHPCQIQAYEELGQLVSLIQKQAKEEGLDLYFNESMQMAGAPVVPGMYSWDKKRIDFLDIAMWGRAEMKSPGFYEVAGRKIFELRSQDGSVKTSQIFYIVASWNLFLKNPASSVYIDNLTVPTGY